MKISIDISSLEYEKLSNEFLQALKKRVHLNK